MDEFTLYAVLCSWVMNNQWSSVNLLLFTIPFHAFYVTYLWTAYASKYDKHVLTLCTSYLLRRVSFRSRRCGVLQSLDSAPFIVVRNLAVQGCRDSMLQLYSKLCHRAVWAQQPISVFISESSPHFLCH